MDRAVARCCTTETTLMHEVMVVAAKHYQVRQTRLTTVGPVFDVVTVNKSRVGATREPTTAIPTA